MIFRGYLDDGRPFITTYFLFPITRNSGYVECLFDTGADATTLNGADAQLLGFNTSSLQPAGQAQGVGSAPKFAIGTIGFAILTNDRHKDIAFRLSDCHVIPTLLYSVLGRDILQQAKLNFDNYSVTLFTSHLEFMVKQIANRFMST